MGGVSPCRKRAMEPLEGTLGNIISKKEGFMTNLTLLKEVAVVDMTECREHTRRLLDLKCENTWERLKLDLIDAGFLWYVEARDLNKFNFLAVVRATQARADYIGDIPDFALERAEAAISLGIREITIHSNEELPIDRTHTDPVMVGWKVCPAISQSRRFVDANLDSWEGVVIAVWDNDKEFEL